MTDIVINILCAKELAKALIDAERFGDAIDFLANVHVAVINDRHKAEEAEMAANKIKRIKAKPDSNKKRKKFSWSPERRAAAKARAVARKTAKNLASDPVLPQALYPTFSA